MGASVAGTGLRGIWDFHRGKTITCSVPEWPMDYTGWAMVDANGQVFVRIRGYRYPGTYDSGWRTGTYTGYDPGYAGHTWYVTVDPTTGVTVSQNYGDPPQGCSASWPYG